MIRFIEKLYRQSPEENLRRLVRHFSRGRRKEVSKENTPYSRILTKLEEMFSYYTIENINEDFISKSDFKNRIESSIGEIEYENEGFTEDQLEMQRDLTVKFHWGHDHDFGSFNIKGRLGKRHLTVLSEFILEFPISFDSFHDKDILEIGCWTGGTTLSLHMLKPRSIISVEEVAKYSNMSEFLIKSFGIKNISFLNKSLYLLNSKQHYEKFDIIYFPGVLYHLTDPVVALRILYNCLRLGGIILLESAAINVEGSICRFDGCKIFANGEKNDLSRGGWNWFIPSRTAVERMLIEAGFDRDIRAYNSTNHPSRLFAYASKNEVTDICRAGLSMPNIR